MIPLLLYVVLIAAMTNRIITELRKLEKEHPTPTKAMETLYSVALLLPMCAGIIPIALVFRYIRLVS
jgi:hypothetical protein